MKKREKGFTLTEVIITLVVLGIVAAITIPIMNNSASDKKWNVARQKAQATIGEAFRLMTVNGEIDRNLSTQQFVEKVIPKYLKLEKTCGSGSSAAGNCGFKLVSVTPKVKKPNGSQVNLPMTFTDSTYAYGVTGTPNSQGAYASGGTNNLTTQNYNNSYFFRTLDGFSVNFFYNPYCSSAWNEKEIIRNPYNMTYVFDYVCLMGIYDMNGKKGPNQVGKDIGFVGSLYNSFNTETTAVLPYSKDFLSRNVGSGTNYYKRAIDYCNNLKEKGDWKLPSLADMVLVYMNKNIAGLSFNNTLYWNTHRGPGVDPRVIVVGSTDTPAGYVYGAHGGAYKTNNSVAFICVRNNALK